MRDKSNANGGTTTAVLAPALLLSPFCRRHRSEICLRKTAAANSNLLERAKGAITPTDDRARMNRMVNASAMKLA